MVFHYAYTKQIDALLNHLIVSNRFDDALHLLKLFYLIHPNDKVQQAFSSMENDEDQKYLSMSVTELQTIKNDEKVDLTGLASVLKVNITNCDCFGFETISFPNQIYIDQDCSQSTSYKSRLQLASQHLEQYIQDHLGSQQENMAHSWVKNPNHHRGLRRQNHRNDRIHKQSSLVWKSSAIRHLESHSRSMMIRRNRFWFPLNCLLFVYCKQKYFL